MADPRKPADRWAAFDAPLPTHYLRNATTSCGELSQSHRFTVTWSATTCRRCRPDAPEPPPIKIAGKFAPEPSPPMHYLQKAATMCGQARRNHRFARDWLVVTCADCRAKAPMSALLRKRSER